MKKIVVFALVALSLFGAPYTIGQSVTPLDVEDQFGKKRTLRVMPKTLIMVFEKGTSAIANDYLAVQDKKYLEKNNAVLVADISQMPNFVAESFALPKMRKYPHTVLLIRDEEQGLQFQGEEEKITVMKFQDNVLTKIEFLSTVIELKKAIEE